MTRTRRQDRGYVFENKLVKELNTIIPETNTKQWRCRRLGGTSIGLPDLIATYNTASVLLAIECKSTVSNLSYIPQDEVIRCNEALDIFGTYRHQKIVLAFKFGRVGSANSKQKTNYYYFVVDKIQEDLSDLHAIRCDRKGNIITISKKEENKFKFIPYYMYRVDDINTLKDSIKKTVILGI